MQWRLVFKGGKSGGELKTVDSLVKNQRIKNVQPSSDYWPAELSADWLEERPDLSWSIVQVYVALAGTLAIFAVPGGDKFQALLRAAEDCPTVSHLILGGFLVEANVAMQPVHPDLQGNQSENKSSIDNYACMSCVKPESVILIKYIYWACAESTVRGEKGW